MTCPYLFPTSAGPVRDNRRVGSERPLPLVISEPAGGACGDRGVEPAASWSRVPELPLDVVAERLAMLRMIARRHSL